MSDANSETTAPPADSLDPTGGPGPILIDPATRRQGMFYLRVAVGCVGFALSMQMGISANFRADVMGLSPWQVGQLEALRESCGMVALGVMALATGVAEPLLGAGMLVLMAVGLGACRYVPDFGWLIVASMVWSQGFHVWIPLPSSMAMALAEPGRTGWRVGQVRSAFAIGSGLGLASALALTWHGVAIRPLFLLAGTACVLGAGACLRIPRRIKTPGTRPVLRRKYSLYYVLSFLEGWRKQIFVCFAGFLLVKYHHTPIQTMLVLFIATNAIGWTVSPWVGRLIDRVGERRVLVAYFLCLTGFFLGYAYVGNPLWLYVLFVLDNAFFAFAIALTTYVRRIAPPAEHTATLTMGVAANHVAAVIVPLVGGWLWKHMGHSMPFLIGAGAALASVPVALRISPRTRASAPA